eukprot:XP_001709701.1 Hypothetical protein GL50803_11966 [Giardia lamblia ATCC 50803]
MYNHGFILYCSRCDEARVPVNGGCIRDFLFYRGGCYSVNGPLTQAICTTKN